MRKSTKIFLNTYKERDFDKRLDLVSDAFWPDDTIYSEDIARTIELTCYDLKMQKVPQFIPIAHCEKMLEAFDRLVDDDGYLPEITTEAFEDIVCAATGWQEEAVEAELEMLVQGNGSVVAMRTRTPPAPRVRPAPVEDDDELDLSKSVSPVKKFPDPITLFFSLSLMWIAIFLPRKR